MVTRAIGDNKLKCQGLTSEPDIWFQEINKEEDMVVVLASDGLWDVAKPEDLLDILKKSPLEQQAELIVEFAKNRNAQDNIAVCVVQLN